MESEYYRAAHEVASIEAWRDVIRRFPEMAKWVAHNKTVPVEILEELADHPDPGVRYVVAGKRKAPSSVLLRLAKDADESVRLAVARNTKAPQETLAILSSDSAKTVAEAARKLLERKGYA